MWYMTVRKQEVFPQAQPGLFGFTFKTRTIENCIRHCLNQHKNPIYQRSLSWTWTKGFLLKRKTKNQLLLASFNETFKFTTNNILTKDYWAFASAQTKTDGNTIITLKTIFSFYVLTHTAASIFNNRAILLWCFEDVGSVVLQLLDALPDVLQRSKEEKLHFNFTIVDISTFASTCTLRSRIKTRFCKGGYHLKAQLHTLSSGCVFV